MIKRKSTYLRCSKHDKHTDGLIGRQAFLDLELGMIMMYQVMWYIYPTSSSYSIYFSIAAVNSNMHIILRTCRNTIHYIKTTLRTSFAFITRNIVSFFFRCLQFSWSRRTDSRAIIIINARLRLPSLLWFNQKWKDTSKTETKTEENTNIYFWNNHSKFIS